MPTLCSLPAQSTVKATLHIPSIWSAHRLTEIFWTSTSNVAQVFAKAHMHRHVTKPFNQCLAASNNQCFGSLLRMLGMESTDGSSHIGGIGLLSKREDSATMAAGRAPRRSTDVRQAQFYHSGLCFSLVLLGDARRIGESCCPWPFLSLYLRARPVNSPAS
jgi:hypothetical protein